MIYEYNCLHTLLTAKAKDVVIFVLYIKIIEITQ